MAARKVKQTELREFLSKIPSYRDGIFVSKGVEVKNKYVDVLKQGDAVQYSLKVGLKPDKRCQWLVRDQLVCTGRGNCQRECGGIGSCIVGCEKSKLIPRRGHRCKCRFVLKMREIGTWEVEQKGQHVPMNVEWHPPVKNPLKELNMQVCDTSQMSVTSLKMRLREAKLELPKDHQLAYFLARKKKSRNSENTTPSAAIKSLAAYDSDSGGESEDENIDTCTAFGLVPSEKLTHSKVVPASTFQFSVNPTPDVCTLE